MDLLRPHFIPRSEKHWVILEMRVNFLNQGFNMPNLYIIYWNKVYFSRHMY